MNIRSVSAIICLVLACGVFLPAARAGEYRETTKFVFNEPVEIPGKILSAGTYWFVLQDNKSDRNVVQIFNADRSNIEAVLITDPTDRLETKPATEVEFAEPYQKPEVLLKWFYPGRLTGHKFLYSASEKRQFAGAVKQDEVTDPLNLASTPSH
jgi:hypothetical protein